jgi:SAM-dependent methyltransferase
MSAADEALFVPCEGSLFANGRSFGWNLVSTRRTQFSYFDQLLARPVWKGRRILDFGGNVGTFLVGAGDRVEHKDYWCIDLNLDVVEQGRRTYPLAHFVHYNRYSPQYNPNGVRHLPIPEWGVKFDFILAFSVFTHVDRSEMLDLVKSLQRLLAPEGVLAFTFDDPYYDRSRSDPSRPPGSAVQRHLESRGGGQPARRIRWCVLIDADFYVEPGDELCHQTRVGKPLESYCSFFTVDYMASLFPGATLHPPVSPEWQHCCILKRPESRLAT